MRWVELGLTHRQYNPTANMDAPSSYIFMAPGAVPHIVTMHQDLATAGIPRKVDRGRCADLHSLRDFFCFQLAKILPMREVQVLMRHSSIKLTIDLYNDLDLKDVADHVRTLPSLFAAEYNAGDSPPG
jgi:integrase